MKVVIFQFNKLNLLSQQLILADLSKVLQPLKLEFPTLPILTFFHFSRFQTEEHRVVTIAYHGKWGVRAQA